MGNISYIRTYANINPERLRGVLVEVNQNVFHGTLKMEEQGEGAWEFEVPSTPGSWYAHLMSPRKFGGKHARGGWELIKYLWTRWQIEVAHRLKARIGDDGISDPNWAPEVGKFDTYLDYLKMWCAESQWDAARQFYAGMYNMEALNLSDELKEVIGYVGPITPEDLKTDADG